MDRNTSVNIVTFDSDFSRAFDEIPHKELLIKEGQIGEGGCSKFWLTISLIEEGSSELITQAPGFLNSQVVSPKDLFLVPFCSVYS